MVLAPGTRLGPYSIVAALGAGGMGEVYRATDTRLDRTVAIKVLAAHVANDPTVKQRFEREAKSLAALSHPHICPVYDVGSQNGTDFLVMEYLEGETLAQRLRKGALPVDLALQVSIQIADALDKAHRKGIVHRDLKPGNIMLTKAGAKLLDFGLATLRPARTVASTSTEASTTRSPLSGAGNILGTFRYMAPEQLEGREADARSDLFAFGAVVYEMVTGKKAFDGNSDASLIGATMETHPPAISWVRPDAPRALDHVVSACLAKTPDERWQTASDLRRELMWIAEDAAAAPLTASPQSRAWMSGRAVKVGAVVLIMVALTATILVWGLRVTPAPVASAVARTAITPPPGESFAATSSKSILAVSPDGRYLAFVATQGSAPSQLYLRAIHGLEAQPVATGEDAANPFFSADSQWLGFWAGGAFRKVSVRGGAATTLTAASDALGASWSDTGTIAFASALGTPILQVSDTGGTARPLTRMRSGENTHAWPEILPGGRALLFTTSLGNFNSSQVAAEVVETGERRKLAEGATTPRFLPSGHLLYVKDGSLIASAFDPETLDITGPAVPVVENVLVNPTTGVAQYSVSPAGTLIYAAAGPAARTLAWVRRDGSKQPVGAPARLYDWPRLSPDGGRVALEIGPQIWLYDFAREALTRFAVGGDLNQAPVWTPDGKRIVFFSTRDGRQNLYWQLADGGGGLERLTDSEYSQVPGSWSPDGRSLAFHQIHPTTLRDIWTMPLGDREPRLLLQTPFFEGAPMVSPDGRWLAYVSNESGRAEVYVRSYPGPGGTWQVSVDGGTEPVWNHNGRELFYRRGAGMMAVDVRTERSFFPGRPRLLFEGNYVASMFPLTGIAYDVSPDGQRFLMIEETDALASSSQIVVVHNWDQELKRLVSAN